MAGHKTTVTLRDDLWVRLRNRATRDGVAVGALITELLDAALAQGPADPAGDWIGAGESGIDDLGTNHAKHLRELLG